MIDWLDSLKNYVESRPIVILRLGHEDWKSIQSSRQGLDKFSIAKKHTELERVAKESLCLIISNDDGTNEIRFGIASPTGAVTTIESRLNVRRSLTINPGEINALANTVPDEYYSQQIKKRLSQRDEVSSLSPNQSKWLLEGLARIDSNIAAMMIIASIISVPRKFDGNAAFQDDAIRTALLTFGLEKGDSPISMELSRTKQTGLARIPFIEDNAIELDSKIIKGYDLIGADLTGCAVFKKGEELLEVITANRRELEHCLGVDLIYINLTHQNTVMLQYKMLEPVENTSPIDWIYRPDARLDDEIMRMKQFRVSHQPGDNEYRINTEFLYLKFVKRDAAISSGAILMPLEHFEIAQKSPAAKGPRGGIRISYNVLHGNYLRPAPFMDLIRSGYIGSYAETTDKLKVIIDSILSGNKAVVAAIQRSHGSS